MVMNTFSGFQVVKKRILCTCRTFLQVVKENISVAQSQPFYVLPTILLKKLVFFSMHVIEARTVDKPKLVDPAEVTLSEPEQDTIDAMNYKTLDASNT